MTRPHRRLSALSFCALALATSPSIMCTSTRSGCARSSEELPALTIEDTLSRRAQLVVFTPRLDLFTALTGAPTTQDALGGLTSFCDRARTTLALDPCARDDWARLGAELSAPAAIAIEDDLISIRFTHEGSGEVANTMRALAAEHSSLTHVDASEAGPAHVTRRTEQGARPILSHAQQRGVSIITLDPNFGQGDDVGDALIAQSSQAHTIQPEERWDSLALHRELRARLSTLGEIHGIGRPGDLVAALPAASPDAARQRDRLGAQLGTLGFATSFDAAERRAKLHILLREELREPTLVKEVKKTEGGISKGMGALIEPGVLGVFRLSADPRELFSLLEMGLAPAQRQEISDLKKRLLDEFTLDVDEAIMDNLTGHAAVVFYGLEPGIFEQDPLALMREIFFLSATREAVYLPLADRVKFARFLDAMTQLSHHKLQRQDVGEMLQYAWREDEELIWAVILNQDHAILVDSTTAFDHAMRHAKHPKPLAPSMAKLKLPRILEEDQQLGLYLDTSSLLTLLPEDATHARAWIRPIKALTITSKPGEKPRSTAIEIDAWLR